MAVEIPGLSLSILRQETRVEQGRPLLISGRLTAFGLGVPAFIRVILEGPSYDPQTRSFDTFASPFSGDYSVNVIAEKGGSFEVYAQAFPPPVVPTGPPFPEAILLLPSIAESSHPPLAIGDFTDGGVDFQLPDGSSRFLQTPPQQPIEIAPIITVAPGITVAAPGVGGIQIPALAGFYPPPEAAPPGVPTEPAEIAAAALEDIRMSPTEINPGQEATGVMSWRNTGTTTRSFDTAVYLVDQRGARHGPLQLDTDQIAAPQIPQLTNLRLGTEGLLSGNYSVQGELYDSVTGQLVEAQTIPYRLSIRAIEAPAFPEVPEVPSLPEEEVEYTPKFQVGDVITLMPGGQPPGPEVGVAEVLPYDSIMRIRTIYPGVAPTYGSYYLDIIAGELKDYTIPVSISFMDLNYMLTTAPEITPELTADILGQPSLNLARSIRVGDVWAGSVSLPTYGLAPYYIAAQLYLVDPTGREIIAGDAGTVLSPSQPLNIPVNLNTYNFTPGDYTIFLRVADQFGGLLQDFPMGFLSMLEAIEELPELPEAPTSPTSAMIQPPLVNLPRTVTLGDPLQGSISIPTRWPATLPSVPSIPSYNYGALTQLEGPTGQRFDVESISDAFTPGRTIDIPISYDTDPLPEAGQYIIHQNLKDFQGRDIFDNAIGLLNVLPKPPEIPEVPEVPGVPELSKFTAISIELGPSEVTVGETINIPLKYTHVGLGKQVIIRAAIGDFRIYGFDDIWANEVSVSVPDDPVPMTRDITIPIRITPKIFDEGIYSLEAKVNHMIPEILTRKEHLIQVWDRPPVLPAAALDVSSPIDVGGSLSYSFEGFQPNSPVSVRVAGGGGLTKTADSKGEGSGSIRLGEPPGDYVLVAEDEHGHRAVAHFTIRGEPTTLKVSTPILQGGSLKYEFTGFQPNASVSIRVAGGGGLTKTADSQGSGSGSFTIGEAPGDYALVARDDYDHVATASFTVQGMPQIGPEYSFSIGKMTASPDRINTGQMVFVSAPVTNYSNKAADVTVYFSFYEGSVLPGRGTFLGRSGGMSKTLQVGETYSFRAARTETSTHDRFDVNCQVAVAGQVIETREDDDVYRKA